MVDAVDAEAVNKVTGVLAIADALKINKVLTSLDVGGSNIGNAGAKAIGEALAANAVLTDLNLFTSQIGDEGAIGEAVTISAVLKELNLRHILRPLCIHEISSQRGAAVARVLLLLDERAALGHARNLLLAEQVAVHRVAHAHFGRRLQTSARARAREGKYTHARARAREHTHGERARAKRRGLGRGGSERARTASEPNRTMPSCG